MITLIKAMIKLFFQGFERQKKTKKKLTHQSLDITFEQINPIMDARLLSIDFMI
jgi:hypothetical protein